MVSREVLLLARIAAADLIVCASPLLAGLFQSLQDGITALILPQIVMLSIRIVHLVITSNTTRYRDIPSASAMLAASGRCGCSCCVRLIRSIFRVPRSIFCVL